MNQPREDRASLVEVRKFAALLDRLPCWEDSGHVEPKQRILLTKSGIRESIGIVELSQSGNVIIDKCVITFASLSLEAHILSDQANDHFNTLLAYGEDVDGCLKKEGGSVKMMARMVAFLQELSVFVNRCYEVFRSLVLQLYHFFALKEDILGRARERKLLRSWRILGNLLSILVKFDEIIQRHTILSQHWSSFFKSMQMMGHNPAQFGADSEYLRPLQSVVIQINAQLMSGFIFKNCCDQIFDEEIRSDAQFSERLRSTILELYEKWERIAAEELADKQRLMAIVTLTTFHTILFRQLDKKLLRTVWASHKKLIAFHIVGDIIWIPCDFMVRSIADIDRIIDRKSIGSIKNLLSNYLDQQTECLSREAANHLAILLEWQCRMAEELREWPKENAYSHLMHRTTLFLRGARQADLILRQLTTILNGHLYEQKAVSRSCATAIFRLIELLKAIEETYLLWWDEVNETCQQAIQHWSGHLLRIINTAKESQRSDSTGNISYQKMDIISALTITELALSTALSRNRLIVAGVALEMACYTKVLRWSDVQQVDDLLQRLDVILNIGLLVTKFCNCSFLFAHPSIIQAYFDCALHDTSTHPQLFFGAISDAATILRASRHAIPDLVFQKYCEEVCEQFEKRFLLKLCEAIETDLRLSIHSYLKLSEPASDMVDYGHMVELLQLAPIRLGHHLIPVKRYVERYLERTFYNLTTVALHDCHTYNEMRLLASHKFGLELCENRLPFETVDQGLDVLVITRNIHTFVSTYNYNLNGQFFIENDSRNKQLNILTVEHIANSIRTHGMGIMNTTINYAYQYLKKKFYVFSQFLFDDHIRGQLTKDVRYFRENFNIHSKMYPVKRAQRFNTAIRRLGVGDDDLSFLDKFRILITQIGNVMGYVRLVRSDGIEASWQSLSFLPDLDDIPSFVELIKNANLSTESIEAAKILDGIFEDATKNVNQTNNYLQILLEVFAKEFRNYEKFEHLSNFFIIVPPLTINFVEHILACKGKLGRRSTQNNTFTDDGFILGVAFILTLLNQLDEFATLNWFQSVETKCSEEMSIPATGKGSVEPSVALRIAKLEQYQKEFRLLFYNYSSSKIFLRAYEGQETSENGAEQTAATKPE